MSKVIQVVVYKSVSDPEKLAAYAVLARPAMEKAGAKIICALDMSPYAASFSGSLTLL